MKENTKKIQDEVPKQTSRTEYSVTYLYRQQHI